MMTPLDILDKNHPEKHNADCNALIATGNPSQPQGNQGFVCCSPGGSKQYFVIKY